MAFICDGGGVVRESFSWHFSFVMGVAEIIYPEGYTKRTLLPHLFLHQCIKPQLFQISISSWLYYAAFYTAILVSIGFSIGFDRHLICIFFFLFFLYTCLSLLSLVVFFFLGIISFKGYSGELSVVCSK